jgi:hypothetical protein
VRSGQERQRAQRTRVRERDGRGAVPAADVEEPERAGEDGHAGLVYARVEDAGLSRVVPERVLRVLALEVVQAVDALLVEDAEALVGRPAERDDLGGVPLRTAVSGGGGAAGGKAGTLKRRRPSPAGE